MTNTGKPIFLSPPHMGGTEMHYIREAFKSGYIAPAGSQLADFEREFSEKTGFPHAVAVSSGTAAIHLALRILGVGPGDEVAVSTLTFIGSVNPVVYLGASPVFIDSERSSWNMDPDLLAEELERCAQNGRFPKVALPTDLYGQPCDMDRIVETCSKYGIPVVSDSAEALGALYNGRSTGIGARAAAFSFNGNKIITTSAGGMLASHDKALIDRAAFLSRQARDPFPHYEHSEIGYNYRMSNILAAIGRGQLEALDDRVKRKREIFRYYQKSLAHIPGIEFMPEASQGKSNRWLTVILINRETFGAGPEDVRTALEKKRVESRPVWKPMHLQPVFRIDGNDKSGVSGNGRVRARAVGGGVSEYLFERGLCLPSGTALTREDMDMIVDTILGCRKN